MYHQNPQQLRENTLKGNEAAFPFWSPGANTSQCDSALHLHNHFKLTYHFIRISYNIGKNALEKQSTEH